MSLQEIKDLENKIKYHKALYYQGRPEIPDHEYDQLEDKLRALDPDSPILNIVGTTVSSLDKVKHDSKMLSLGKTYDLDELIRWKDKYDIIGMYKIDGISCSLVYENGHLVLAKTRGDGTYGENITNKVMWLNSVPKVISIKNKVEIRGELFCREKQFFSLSDEMESIGQDRPSSQRNIVAGLMGRKEGLELCRYLDFKAFDIISESMDLKTEMDKYHTLKNELFDVLQIELFKDSKGIEDFIEGTKEFMAEGDYLIDGIVFAYNELSLHRELGETAHHPRYKMAFKFQGESKQTKINSLEWNVSRNGILTPVAIVEPVELSGAKISRVTLHNYGMVRQFKLKKNDIIEIIRSGEVIPKFMSVIESSLNEYIVPKSCPSCDEEVFEEDIRLVCKNNYCPAIVKESILNFIQKIGIEDLSAKRLDEMIRTKLVTRIEDLYKLSVEDFLTLDKVKDKLANKFYDEIQSSKKADLTTFLSALGISGGAYNKCEKVVNAGIDSIEKIRSLNVELLVAIDGFAEKSANEFVKSLKSKDELIGNLISLGFDFTIKDEEDLKLSGLNFVITGSLSEKRSVIEGRIRDAGGKTGGSVSKNTSYLICNDKESSSSKAKKARDLNIPILSEEELKEMI